MIDPKDPRDPPDEEDLVETEGLDEGTDAGQVDDESGDDAQTGQEFEGDQAEERVDRRSRRDDQLREELRAEREHRARVEAELNIIRQSREQQQARPHEESDIEFEARIALLDPETRISTKVDRALRRQAQQLALQSYAMADRTDKMTYDAQAATNPLYRKHAAAVEATMAQARQRGMDINREAALRFVLGGERLTNFGKTSPAQQQAQRRVQSQQARTTGGRGDQGRGEQRQRRYASNDMSPEAVKQRLEASDAFI